MRKMMRTMRTLGMAFIAVPLLMTAQPLLADDGHHGHSGYRTARREALRELGAAGLGALDLNVKPKKAEVYVDGRYVGLAKDFDGSPGYLWLKEGTHEVIFYKEGYGTVVREFTVHPGAVIEVKQRMVRGESVPAEELTSKLRGSDTDTGQKKEEPQKAPRANRPRGY